MLIRRIIALVFLMGLTASCGVEVQVTLDKSAMESEIAAPPSPGDGITVVTAYQGAAGVVDCVLRTMATAHPSPRVVLAKDLPESIYRWNARNAAIGKFDIDDLKRLVQQPAAKEEISAARVRYVVMIDTDTIFYISGLSSGNHLPVPLGMCEATFGCRKKRIDTARVWDLVADNEVVQGTATADGGVVSLTYYAVTPETETPACEASGASSQSSSPVRQRQRHSGRMLCRLHMRQRLSGAFGK